MINFKSSFYISRIFLEKNKMRRKMRDEKEKEESPQHRSIPDNQLNSVFTLNCNFWKCFIVEYCS